MLQDLGAVQEELCAQPAARGLRDLGLWRRAAEVSQYVEGSEAYRMFAVRRQQRRDVRALPAKGLLVRMLLLLMLLMLLLLRRQYLSFQF